MRSPETLSLVLPFFPFAFAIPWQSPHPKPKPAAFFLAGDSTTAPQSSDGGGWGNGFLSFLIPPAWGVNFGHDGATTVSFVEGSAPNWANITSELQANNERYDCWVTIQFGHNDQKPAANISLSEYQTNLENLAGDVKELGGHPILVTPLTRRVFNSTHVVEDSLHDQRLATIAAAEATNTTYIDLNLASIEYVDAIGNASAQKYDLNGNDTTHLNAWGSVVFGRMVADLILAKEPQLERWIAENETLSWEIWHGIAA